VAQRPDQPRVGVTDFFQSGLAANFRRWGFSADGFLIDHSNEQVYIPDDGSIEFRGPSRAYGYESKLSLAITRKLAFQGGLTKIANAFYRGGDHRVYVDSAPHFVADAALTVAAWHGWSGSLRMRAINHYRLDGVDPSVVASGHTVFDLAVLRRIRRGVELNLSLDNLTNRDYYETQNYFESRVTPGSPVVARIHGTPGYPLAAVIGLTFRLRGK
jgi:outer membrane receptor protein involved in Fe transport